MWEHGVYEPNDYLLVKMARYFHVTTDYLVGKNADLPEKYDEDTLAFLDLIQNRNEVKTLLRAAKNATKEEIETVITMLEEIIRSYA